MKKTTRKIRPNFNQISNVLRDQTQHIRRLNFSWAKRQQSFRYHSRLPDALIDRALSRWKSHEVGVKMSKMLSIFGSVLISKWSTSNFSSISEIGPWKMILASVNWWVLKDFDGFWWVLVGFCQRIRDLSRKEFWKVPKSWMISFVECYCNRVFWWCV